MSKAEDRAFEAYPYSRAYTDSDIEYDGNFCNRLPYIEGYEQAEEDFLQKLDYFISKIDVSNHSYEDLEDLYDNLCELIKNNHIGYIPIKKCPELTWEDIASILDVTDVIANDDSMEERLKTMSEEEYCQEILKRFNKERQK